MVSVTNLYKDKFTVYIGRPGKGKPGPLGNPFIVGRDGGQGECAELFQIWFYSYDPSAIEYRKLCHQLIKPNDILGCFCKPKVCHGDTISEYMNFVFEHSENTWKLGLWQVCDHDDVGESWYRNDGEIVNLGYYYDKRPKYYKVDTVLSAADFYVYKKCLEYL